MPGFLCRASHVLCASRRWMAGTSPAHGRRGRFPPNPQLVIPPRKSGGSSMPGAFTASITTVWNTGSPGQAGAMDDCVLCRASDERVNDRPLRRLRRLLASWIRAPDPFPGLSSGMSMVLDAVFGEARSITAVWQCRRGCRRSRLRPQPLVPSGLDFAGEGMIADRPWSGMSSGARQRVVHERAGDRLGRSRRN